MSTDVAKASIESQKVRMRASSAGKSTLAPTLGKVVSVVTVQSSSWSPVGAGTGDPRYHPACQLVG
jgi:hypothetical protein